MSCNYNKTTNTMTYTLVYGGTVRVANIVDEVDIEEIGRGKTLAICSYVGCQHKDIIDNTSTATTNCTECGSLYFYPNV